MKSYRLVTEVKAKIANSRDFMYFKGVLKMPSIQSKDE